MLEEVWPTAPFLLSSECVAEHRPVSDLSAQVVVMQALLCHALEEWPEKSNIHIRSQITIPQQTKTATTKLSFHRVA